MLVSDAPENLRKLLDCLAGWGEGWARELQPADLVFLKEYSWRDKDKLDVLAMREIIARESH